MRKVDRPYTRPNACAAKPHIGASSHPDEKWVDTGAELNGFDNHVYLCETSIREAASTLGLEFIDDDEIVRLVDENERLKNEAADNADQIAELEVFKESVYIAIGSGPDGEDES